MKRNRFAYALSLSLGLFTLVPLFILVPPMANTQGADSIPVAHLAANAVSGPVPPAAAAAGTSESWRLGVTSEGSAAFNAVIGRPAGDAAAFRSNRGTSDVYFIFPAPGSQRTVQAAKFSILSRTGTYAGDATLTLEILDYGGVVQHTVSASGVDMKAAPIGTWTGITLSGTAEDLMIAPGEFLAFHFSLGSTPGGDLDVRPIFEVDVQ